MSPDRTLGDVGAPMRGPVWPIATEPQAKSSVAPHIRSGEHGPSIPDTTWSAPNVPRSDKCRSQAQGQGVSNKDIGSALFITERTARTYVSNILGKLGLATRTQAALHAVEHKLVDGPKA